MRLVLIRHGESEHGRRDVIAGVAGCTGLTERGIEQARVLAARLRATGELSGCAALLCSPVLRARQTAEVLVPALSAGAIERDRDLCELHPGVADGLTWEEYRARYDVFDPLAFPTRPFAPGGESWLSFTERVQAVLGRLAQRFAGETVVVVTHAGFIVASVLVVFAIPRPGTAARLDPALTSLTEWRVAEGIWQLARYNDTAHLVVTE